MNSPFQKILFLDIDGVLNSTQWWRSLSHEEIEQRCLSKDQFDPAAVTRLNTIVERSGTQVVVSSTWRLLYHWDELMETLSRNGVNTSVIVGKTPTRLCPTYRGDEISLWLSRNECESIAILDDDSDMGALCHRLIQTSYTTGLEDQHIDPVIAMLDMPWK